MAFVFGALLDPSFEDGALGWGEGWFVGLGRGHDLVWVGADDALPSGGLGGISGDDAADAVVVFGGTVEGVEAEVGLAVFGVETVTGEAIFREDGADVAVETDLGLRLGGVEGCSSEGG
jgi:hypothetical protein